MTEESFRVKYPQKNRKIGDYRREDVNKLFISSILRGNKNILKCELSS